MMGSDTLLQPNQAKVVDPATGKYSEVLLSVTLPNVVNGDVFSYCNLQKIEKVQWICSTTILVEIRFSIFLEGCYIQ